jgi:hypothetical protein
VSWADEIHANAEETGEEPEHVTAEGDKIHSVGVDVR